MHCKNCDKILDDDSKFCIFCGVEQGATSIPAEDSTIPPEEPEKIEPIPITNANLKVLSNLILQQKKEEVVGYLDKMIQTPEDAVQVIKKYRSLYQKDIIAELKGLSASYARIKHHLSRFIVFGIIEEDYPHEFKPEYSALKTELPPKPTGTESRKKKRNKRNKRIIWVLSFIVIFLILIFCFRKWIHSYNPIEMIHITTGIFHGFYIGKTEITQKQWKIINPKIDEIFDVGTDEPISIIDDNHPMNFITWMEAIEFCNQLSEKNELIPCYDIISEDSVSWNFSANGYRLPTEAEWEYAARGGHQSNDYEYAGSNNIDEVAWCFNNSNGTTHPVRDKLPNEFGIYDMSGNVSEFCWDNWIDPEVEVGLRVCCLKGGGYLSQAKVCSLTKNSYIQTNTLSTTVGFRIVRSTGILVMINSLKVKIFGEERIFWKNIKKANDIKSYKRYLTNYSNGKFTIKAKKRIEALEWANATLGNSVESYKEYLINCPKGDYVDEAKTKVFKTSNKIIFEMIYVEGGKFKMGCTSEQFDCDNDEYPVHTVNMSNFYIGKTEVTQKQWKSIMGNNPSHFKSDNLPVETVFLHHAMIFCNLLSMKEGLTPCYYSKRHYSVYDSCDFTANGYRLPTEAEWEYTARGGNKSKNFIYSGSNNINEVAWYYKNSNGKTHPVSLKAPNELGIHDMSGNVSEFCWDKYKNTTDPNTSDYYSRSPENNPKGESKGRSFVMRGGYFGGGDCRVANRYADSWASTSYREGFRLVHTAL